MNLSAERFSKSWIAVAMSFVLLEALGCNFGPSKKTEEKTAVVRAAGAANPSEPQFRGGLYCVETMSQTSPGPSQPVHFSYKINESDGTTKDFEADLAADTFDVTINKKWPATEVDRELSEAPVSNPIRIHDGFAESTNTNHHTRADLSNWTAGWGMTEQGGTPWGLFILKPPITRVGAENIGGYDTIKYTVDTTQQSKLEKLAGTMGQNGADYNITGSAWVTKDTGCVLQYNIDDEETAKDGKVSKTHYEGTVTKK